MIEMKTNAEPYDMKDFVIVGASSPIAQEIVAGLGKKNFANITLVYRTEESRLKYASLIENCQNLNISTIVCDIAQPPEVKELIRLISKNHKKLDGFIYLAAQGGMRVPFQSLSDEDVRDIFEVNVISAFIMLKECLKFLTPCGGSAVFTGSQAAVTGGRKIAAYSASKAALHQMVSSVAREVASCGVRVNCVSPAIIDTPKMRKSNNIISEEQLDELANTIPMGRVGRPLDIASAILWLLSEDANYISGCILPVTGAR